MIRKRRKIMRPLTRKPKYNYYSVYRQNGRPTWKIWKWRIMFTVTWTKPAEYAKGVVSHGNGYFYTDTTYAIYATPTVAAVSFSGTGKTLDAAVKDLESKITARHSKTIDAAIESQLAEFKAAVSK